MLLLKPQELTNVYECLSKCTNRYKRFKDQEQYIQYCKLGDQKCGDDDDN